jgi:hypothetical protein
MKKDIELDFDVLKSFFADNDDDECAGLEALQSINDEYARLLEKVERLTKEYKELNEANDILLGADELLGELQERVAIFRDPSNWKGTHFCPVLTYQQTDAPYNLLG